MRNCFNIKYIEIRICGIIKLYSIDCIFLYSYKRQFTVVPILVGSLSSEREACYGRILSTYLADPQNLFVISSDFCHWGQRFHYTYYDRSYGSIFQSIEGLDRAVCLLYSFMYSNIVSISGNEYYWKFKSHRIFKLLKKIWQHNLW